MKVLATVAALLIVGCATTGATRIHNHEGGYILDEIAKISRARDAGQRVQISGKCYSACTLWLSYENICVKPGTRFGFHEPYDGHTGVSLPSYSEMMYKAYPDWAKDFVDETDALSHEDITVMPYSYTRQFVRGC